MIDQRSDIIFYVGNPLILDLFICCGRWAWCTYIYSLGNYKSCTSRQLCFMIYSSCWKWRERRWSGWWSWCSYACNKMWFIHSFLTLNYACASILHKQCDVVIWNSCRLKIKKICMSYCFKIKLTLPDNIF